MKKALVIRLVAGIAIASIAGYVRAAEGTDGKAVSIVFYVSPAGDDRNDGSEEKPFATLERARDAARRAGEGPVTIHLASSAFRLTKTFELDERDANTTFKGTEGTRITGSVVIPNTAVQLVKDAAILERLLPEARGKVVAIDLHALGITDFGELGPRGFRRPYIPAPIELIVNGEPLTVAQWPNPGEKPVAMGRVIDPGPVTRKGVKPTRGGKFTFKTDRPLRWTQARDIWLTGIFNQGWADNTVKIASIDIEEKSFTTVHPDMYGFAGPAGFRGWRALNLLEEIDLPGEFMADSATGKLFFLPPAGVDLASVPLEVTVVKTPLVAMEGATNVIFDGVDFENSRGMGVYIERGANNRIQNATLRNLGMVAVSVGNGIAPDPDFRHGFTGVPISRELGSWHEHIYDNPEYDRDAGTGHGVVNCHIYNIGAGAISLGGGNRLTLTPGGNFVDNCRIHHFNRWDRTYKGAVNIEGVGNRISHNVIHDGPALAIYLHGNDHVIEYNDIRRVVLEGHDMGALYIGRDPTERGNIIRYNLWRDLALQHMNFCLYFDDSGGDALQVYGNVFYRAGNRATVFLTGGSDFLVENNLFVDCRQPIVQQGFRGGHLNIFRERMELMKYDQPPWSKRYPEMAGYFQAARPRNNVVRNNLVIKGDDPRLTANPKDGDFSLKPDVDTGIENWQPIPFDKIGLRPKE